ncbi:MAG: DHHA1 domain-containing protein, partial [Lactobacillaceae bacterium]
VSDQWRNQKISDLLILASNKNGKAAFLVAFAKDKATKTFNAKELINKFAQIFDGHGGGNILLAVAGGKASSKIQDAIEQVSKIIANFN